MTDTTLALPAKAAEMRPLESIRERFRLIERTMDEFLKTCPTSRNLENDIASLTIALGSLLTDYDYYIREVEDTLGRLECKIDETSEIPVLTKEIPGEIADTIDQLLGAPDIALRRRLEEFSKRMRCGEPIVEAVESNGEIHRAPFGRFRDSVSNISSTIR